MEDYRALDSFSKVNDKWVDRAAELGEQAALSALARAGLSPADVDHIFFTTVTGIASPSIDAKLVNRLSMRPTSSALRSSASVASAVPPDWRERRTCAPQKRFALGMKPQ